MSHVDAEQALSIYRHFCKQAEFVVEYLGVAKKLQNLLNVPIPNLKHVRPRSDLISTLLTIIGTGTYISRRSPGGVLERS
jgi:hypothetical protein